MLGWPRLRPGTRPSLWPAHGVSSSTAPTPGWESAGSSDAARPDQLPGSLPAQGIGDDVTVNTTWTGDIVDRSWFTAPEYERYRQPGNVKVPFWLQPEKYYAGAAWYQRDIEIPQALAGQAASCSPWSGRTGRRASGWTAGSSGIQQRPGHAARIRPGPALAPGRHRLTIRVDNRLVVDVGENSHSVTDHTRGTGTASWAIELARDRAGVDRGPAGLSARRQRESVMVKGRIGNATGQRGQGISCRLSGRAAPAGAQAQIDVVLGQRRDGTFETEIAARAMPPCLG